MERAYEQPAAAFARQILQKHPQISYEHAVAAAEFNGVDRLPRDVFFDVADELGLARDRHAAEPAAPLSSATRSSQPSSSGPGADLIAQLEACKHQSRENAAIRAVLEQMRSVVRAALADDAPRPADPR